MTIVAMPCWPIASMDLLACWPMAMGLLACGLNPCDVALYSLRPCWPTAVLPYDPMAHGSCWPTADCFDVAGDFGLGFFGCSISSSSYLINHKDVGLACYLCNLVGNHVTQGVDVKATLKPADLYNRRVYLEPLALYLTLDIGTFESVSLDTNTKAIHIQFNPMAHDNITYVARRLRVQKMSDARPGSGFNVTTAGVPLKVSRGAYVVPVASSAVAVTWA